MYRNCLLPCCTFAVYPGGNPCLSAVHTAVCCTLLYIFCTYSACCTYSKRTSEEYSSSCTFSVQRLHIHYVLYIIKCTAEKYSSSCTLQYVFCTHSTCFIYSREIQQLLYICCMRCMYSKHAAEKDSSSRAYSVHTVSVNCMYNKNAAEKYSSSYTSTVHHLRCAYTVLDACTAPAACTANIHHWTSSIFDCSTFVVNLLYIYNICTSITQRDTVVEWIRQWTPTQQVVGSVDVQQTY